MNREPIQRKGGRGTSGERGKEEGGGGKGKGGRGREGG